MRHLDWESEEAPPVDPCEQSILDSQGAQDESVGGLTVEEWDALASACEEIVGQPWKALVIQAIAQIHEDERARVERRRVA